MKLADVALPVPLGKAFTYEIPAHLEALIVPGTRVVCPFGGRRLAGVVLETREGEPPPKVKAIAEIAKVPSIPEDLLSLLKEVAAYYLAPIGEVMRLALPPLDRETDRALKDPSLFDTARGVSERTVQWITATSAVEPSGTLSPKAAALLAHIRSAGALPLARLSEAWPTARAQVKKLEELGLVRSDKRARPNDPFFSEEVEKDAPHEPTAAQSEANARISEALRAGEAASFLLHGVTGSGKTEVYLRAISHAKELGRGIIVLVPEIALTPQLVGRFRARFGDDVAVLHSGLTPKERFLMWMRLRSGEVHVAIGARSALFAPVSNVGLIVVDEEHDPSFKQEEGVRYHARDMAILRAHRSRAVCILGSATPSLESEYLSRTGKLTKLSLPSRARANELPKIEIVDLRRIGAGPTGDKRISIHLHRAIEETLARREQGILFLNRRGFSPSVRCEACGTASSCPHCSVALTYHKGRRPILRCHYCDFETELLVACAKCGQNALVLEGLGTEKLEETLQTAFPTARIARLDRDVASGRNVEKVLARVRNREVDILVGTQMVTKGHDLPSVTLVGVINADAALSIPDFRASERAFQLMVQVAGRAGRADAKGRVLIQTYDPENAAITFAATHDVNGFLDREFADRKELSYPPFSRMALVRVDAPEESVARAACEQLTQVALTVREGEKSVDIVGPAAAPVARVRNRFRFRTMIRAAERPALRRVCAAILRAVPTLPRTVRVTVDIDPVQLL